MRRGRVVLLALLGVVAVVVVAVAAWAASLEARMRDPEVVTEELNESLVEREEPSDPYYALLMGTDGRSGDTEYRADSIILARVDPARKRVTLLSIPRDTRIVWQGSVLKMGEVHAYAGAAGMVQAVSELCGVQISHYAEVNFNGLKDITDAVGGVTVDVDQDMWDAIHFKKVTELSAGVQTLDGNEALFYVRCRYFPDGDYTRMRHQRTFVKALIGKIMETADPATLFSLVNACADMVVTDLSVTDIVGLATEMIGMDVNHGIYMAHVPSEAAEIDGISYVVADEGSLRVMMTIIDAGADPSVLEDDAEAGQEPGEGAVAAQPVIAAVM